MFDAARPVGIEGACVSPGHAVVAASTEERAEWLPAASYASTPSVYVVPHARLPKLYPVLVVEPTLVPFRKTS